MRQTKLISAAIALAALFMLVPAGALAARGAAHHHGRRGPARLAPRGASAGSCRVSIAVAPRRVNAGEAVSVYGRLTCGGAGASAASPSIANQQVTVYAREATASTASSIGTASTDTNGFYAFTTPTPPSTNTAYYVSVDGAQSPTRNARVATRVEIKNAPAEGAQLATGPNHSVTFSGAVPPIDHGALVVLQREDAITGEQWHRIGPLGTRVGPNGTFSISHTFHTPGDANLRFVVRPRGINAPSASEVLSYEISQTQNPGLTILSSGNPLSYGQLVTIKGTLAGAKSQQVTLLAHTRSGAFATAATTTTNGSGEYSFAPQTPLQSTFYKVTGGGRSSAIMYEGVKYLLTASVSPMSVQNGQSLTFSGAVTPGHEGQPVYLQRQNPLGGYHVVQVGTVNANSTYSIVHTPFDAANTTKTEIFRIKVPGNPQNESKASEPFTITVNPALASALTPETPANSTSPSEGQT